MVTHHIEVVRSTPNTFYCGMDISNLPIQRLQTSIRGRGTRSQMVCYFVISNVIRIDSRNAAEDVQADSKRREFAKQNMGESPGEGKNSLRCDVTAPKSSN